MFGRFAWVFGDLFRLVPYLSPYYVLVYLLADPVSYFLRII